MKYLLFISLTILFTLICVAPGRADERESLSFILEHNPVPHVGKKPVPEETFFRQTNELKLVGATLLRLYQVFISPQDKPSCPFSPTCGEYARQAVSKYGLVRGIIMAADRYQRCNGLSARFYTVEEVTGRLYDPP